MITVEWQQDAKCTVCLKDSPHCADIRIEPKNTTDKDGKFGHIKLCSTCVADLVKRLS